MTPLGFGGGGGVRHTQIDYCMDLVYLYIFVAGMKSQAAVFRTISVVNK